MRSVAVFGGFMLAYMAVLVSGKASGLAWSGGGISIRYLVPMWLPFLIVAALFLDAAFAPAMRGMRFGKVPANAIRGVMVTASAIICIFIAAMLTITALDTNRVRTATLSGISSMHSLNILKYIQDNPIQGTVYTNAPSLVYFFTDGKAGYRNIPKSRRAGYIIDNSNAGISGGEQLHRWAATLSEGDYVVWIKVWYDIDLYDFTPADIQAHPEMELIQDLDDGVIFRVKREND